MLLIGLAAAMVFPMLVELNAHTLDWQVFATSSFLTLFVGGLLYISNRGKMELDTRHTFIFTTSVWLIIPMFASLPFVFTSSRYHLGIVDALFESISGLTTTGSTVMMGLDSAPVGLLLWRSLLEWFGGVGIVVLAMAVLPQLGVSGMQLFRSESSDKSDKIMPRARQVAVATFVVYSFLTFLCMAAYYMAGMDGFDAINHAMATISTGGFSTHDASMGFFDSALIEDIGSIFMFLGGIPLLLYFAVISGKRAHPILVAQARVYALFSGAVILIISIWLTAHHQYSFDQSLRYAAFNVISIITTTGFASVDYGLWGGVMAITIYFLTIIGGCTGSTSGGMKIFRFMVMGSTLKKNFRQLYMPHGVFRTTIAGTLVGSEVEMSVKVFFMFFALTFSLVAGALAMFGLDFVTSMSAAGTALANVGPGLGDIIGPSGNFAGLPDGAKLVLAFAMIVGRLEILTVAVILTPLFWREL